ncbi:MAG: CARDB domain-containing protein, partial [Persicimonas sp.]
VLDPACDADPVPDECRSRGVLWATPNQDCSSRATASSVFDFEGDGKAEMVYADESTFRIIDGTDGSVLFEDTSHGSNTRIEMPLVADIDNDRNSEVVVPSATNSSIKVFADSDDNWVRTRRIWNQHAYSVTNVTEDGAIPASPDRNWRNGRLNNFRQNIQPGGVFDAPDLTVDEIALADSCVGQDQITIEVIVGNEGAVGEPAGIEVDVMAEHDGDLHDIDTVETSKRLLPGETETVSTTFEVPEGWWDDGFSLRANVDPNEAINECDEDNNEESRDADELTGAYDGLEITNFEASDASCGVNQQVPIDLTVENTDDEALPSGVPIVLEAVMDGEEEQMATLQTSSELDPGDTEELSTDWQADSPFYGEEFEVTATIDPEREVLDCPSPDKESQQVDCTPEG